MYGGGGGSVGCKMDGSAPSPGIIVGLSCNNTPVLGMQYTKNKPVSLTYFAHRQTQTIVNNDR
jgi:hypothetical protein